MTRPAQPDVPGIGSGDSRPAAGQITRSWTVGGVCSSGLTDLVERREWYSLWVLVVTRGDYGRWFWAWWSKVSPEWEEKC